VSRKAKDQRPLPPPPQHGQNRLRLDATWLRAAIAQERKWYRQPVSIPPAYLTGANSYLVGKSKTGLLLIGVTAGLNTQEHSEILGEVREFIQGLKAQIHDIFRIEVFVPPDVLTVRLPSSINNIRLEWFKWAFDDRNGIELTRLRTRRRPASGSSTNSSTLNRLLGHLAWMEQALREASTPESPYRKALLALNTATLLDWHFTVPGKASSEQLRDPKASKKAAKLIEEFVAAARACASKTEFLTGTNAEQPLGTLADTTAGFLKKATKLWEVEVTARREPEFEKPLRPEELISEWLAGNQPRKSASNAAAGRRSTWVPENPEDLEHMECIYAQLPAWAAQKLFDEGKLPADGYAAARKISATFLEEALDVVIDGAKGAERKRWQALGRPVIESLRKPVAARSGKAGV
jgi:hypothetical protein